MLFYVFSIYVYTHVHKRHSNVPLIAVFNFGCDALSFSSTSKIIQFSWEVWTPQKQKCFASSRAVNWKKDEEIFKIHGRHAVDLILTFACNAVLVLLRSTCQMRCCWQTICLFLLLLTFYHICHLAAQSTTLMIISPVFIPRLIFNNAPYVLLFCWESTSI